MTPVIFFVCVFHSSHTHQLPTGRICAVLCLLAVHSVAFYVCVHMRVCLCARSSKRGAIRGECVPWALRVNVGQCWCGRQREQKAPFAHTSIRVFGHKCCSVHTLCSPAPQGCGEDLSAHQLHHQCLPRGIHTHRVSTEPISHTLNAVSCIR